MKGIGDRIRKLGKLDEKMKEWEESRVDALCEHLGLLGLDATKIVFFKKMKQRTEFFHGVEETLGAIRLANRNIDLVEQLYCF